MHRYVRGRTNKRNDMNTKNIFISHSWNHSEHYERLVGILERRGYWCHRNYSVPKTNPLTLNSERTSDRELRTAIRDKMRQCSTVLVVAGPHASNSKWMREEVTMAKNDFSPPKAVIAIRPYGAERTSVFATENADETVNWNADSIVDAIRRLTR